MAILSSTPYLKSCLCSLLLTPVPVDRNFPVPKISLKITQINKFLETDFTINVNVKNQRCFDRSTVIFKVKSKIFV